MLMSNLGRLNPASMLPQISPNGAAPVATMGIEPCQPPPGFTWDPAQVKYRLLAQGETAVLGPGTELACRWSPINFPGEGMVIGPFTFPWTQDTMPGGFGPDLCVGEHDDYRGVNGKNCQIWTTVIHDPLKLPAAIVPLLQKILLSDVEGNGHGFGNFWYNDHWTGADGSQGQAITLNQYQMWLSAFGMHADQDYYLNFIPVADNGHGYAEQWFQGVPIVQFDHPNKFLGRYGVWLSLESTGGFDAPLALRITVDSIADAHARANPASTFGKIMHALNPLNWPGMLVHLFVQSGVPQAIGDKLGPIIDAAGDLACHLLSNPTVVTGIKVVGTVEGGPAGGAAASAGVQVAQNQCGPNAPDCKDPKNAKLPQCVPTLPLPPISPSPWYLRWYVIVGAAVGLGLLLTMKPKAER